MGHGPCIFTKLLGAHQVCIFYSLDPRGAMIGTELLFPKNRETFLKT